MNLIKSLVKAPFSLLGLELQRKTADPVEVQLRRRLFKTVLDIGADAGEFSEQVRRCLPGAHIYGFEPLPQSFRKLQERFKADSAYTAHQTALGDRSGEIEFFQDEFTAASSVLPLSDTCKTTFPEVGRTVKTKVPVLTLDDWAEGLTLPNPMLIKMDVQGYEKPVILGGRNLLSRADMLVIEVSFVELYEGQALFCEIHSLLSGMGFTLRGIKQEALGREMGFAPQANAFYERLSA